MYRDNAADGTAPLFEAGAAAERLGVSPSGLRRLGEIYERVHNELPRKPKTEARLWPELALERLEGARALVEAGEFRAIADALEALASGFKPDIATAELSIDGSSDVLLQRVLAELVALRHEVGTLHEQNTALQRELRQLSTPVESELGPLLRPTRAGSNGPVNGSDFARSSVTDAKADTSSGLLVRVAVKLEQLLRRFRR